MQKKDILILLAVIAVSIIRRGNDAEIRRKGDGYIVLEVKKTIKYSTPA